MSFLAHWIGCLIFYSGLERGSYMSAHVLLRFIKRVGEKRYNARLAKHFISFLQRVINSVKQEHEC